MINVKKNIKYKKRGLNIILSSKKVIVNIERSSNK